MKFQSLGESSNSYFIQIQGLSILIDCGLYFQDKTIQTTNEIDYHYPEIVLPEFNLIDISNIDIILITNFHQMLSLPFLTEYHSFCGKILATEPTIEIGYYLMKELVLFYENSSHQTSLPKIQKSDLKEKDLFECFTEKFSNNEHNYTMYTYQDITNCIAKIQRVSFLQKTTINSLTFIPTSSGFCIGSSNWLIQSDYQKICFIGDSSFEKNLHPECLDLNSLKNSDFLISTQIENSLQSFENLKNSFFQILGTSLTFGGNILLPVHSCGIVLDLIEGVYNFLNSTNRGGIPIYFVSPSSEFVLLYSNILGEWLCNAKKEKLYLPEQPFPFEDLVKNNKLFFQSNVNGSQISYRNGISNFPFDHGSSIIFTNHTSLFLGPIVDFLNSWKKSSKHSLILTCEESKNNIAHWQNQKDFKMKVFYNPVDSRLRENQFSEVISTLNPKKIIFPQNGFKFKESIDRYSYKPLERISLSLHRKFEKAFISKDLALQIKLNQIQNNLFFQKFSTTLHFEDNHYLLDFPQTYQKSLFSKNQNLLFGKIQISRLVEIFFQQGIKVLVEEEDENVILIFPNREAKIEISQNPNFKTKIFATDQFRQVLLNAILTCLNFNDVEFVKKVKIEEK